MDRGIFVALSGAVVQERRLDILADNLANVNTTGFKKQEPLFRDAFPKPFGPRTFTWMNDVVNDMSAGANKQTGRNLDLALNGEGFFEVETPYGTRYTRAGEFTLDPAGTLVTQDGYAVAGENGPIKLGAEPVEIDAQGVIKQGGAEVARLKLAFFDSPKDLIKEGALFTPEGTEVKEVASIGTTQVEQGYLEYSNVNAVKAMITMIEAQRSYESHTKMIQNMDELTRKAIEEIGRVG